MNKQDYFEKLKDPRWQKKRLEIFERDEFTCMSCGYDNKTLTVHHNYYDVKLAPWEYPEEALITLCEDCHKEIQTSLKLLKESIKNIYFGDAEFIRGIIDNVNNHGDESGIFHLTDYNYAAGLTYDSNLLPEEVINNADSNNCITMAKINELQKRKANE